MFTRVNPGSYVIAEGSFEIHGQKVFDNDTGEVVSLSKLLRAYMFDPDDKLTGRVRITIEYPPRSLKVVS